VLDQGLKQAELLEVLEEVLLEDVEHAEDATNEERLEHLKTHFALLFIFFIALALEDVENDLEDLRFHQN